MPELETLQQLSEGLLHSAGRTAARHHVLEMHHEHAPRFEADFLHTESERYGLEIRLGINSRNGDGRVACRTGDLPFRDGEFCRVILHHVLTDGSEPELQEACRVLAPDGVLLIIGLNPFGWRYLRQDRIRRLPPLKIWSVRRKLSDFDMEMQGFAGAGLLGRSNPEFLGPGWSAAAVPLADVLLIQASHRDYPQVTPLRFRKPRAGVVQSAAMQG